MSNSAEAVRSSDRSSDAPDVPAAHIQQAVSEMFKSAPFRASKQSQHLLQYIIDHSLAGHVERLKERIIGAEVFGRAPEYDTNADPIVRARVAEVRKRLAQYYLGEGYAAPVRIEISPGSYLATFSIVEQDAVKEASLPSLTVAPVDSPETQASGLAATVAPPASVFRRLRPYLGWWVTGAILALLVFVQVEHHVSAGDPVKRFWAPLLDGAKPVLIYTGANPVYMPGSQLIEHFKATHHVDDLETSGHEFLIPIADMDKLRAGDLIEIKNEFVTIGDVAANVSVTSLLTRFKRSFDLRSGEDVSFGDLRQTPTVLVGGFNNGWTLQLTGDLPYVFGSGLTIRERSNPAHQWHPVISSENKVQLDYALVARLPHSKTGAALLTAAGITQSGTRAAAEFISSAQGIRELMQSASPGWMDKNLEFVLQTKVVNDIPTTPTIVAIREW